MEEITQLELQNIKRLIETSNVLFQKLNSFSSNCVDPQIKQMFTKAAQEELNKKQRLISLLN